MRRYISVLEAVNPFAMSIRSIFCECIASHIPHLANPTDYDIECACEKLNPKRILYINQGRSKKIKVRSKNILSEFSPHRYYIVV